MSLPRRSYLITLNSRPICVVYSSGAHTAMIVDEMRLDHFEEIFGVPISPKTTGLEVEYEIEYNWDYIEIDSVTSSDAERRCAAIATRKLAETGD